MGKNWSVGCDIMCGALALKIAISLKNGEQKNWKISTLNAFSPYFLCRCCSLIIVSRRRKRRGKNLSVGCNIMCCILALKIAISLKKGEQKNWKIINTHFFLTILFALLLDCNVFVQAAAVAWQKLVYGLRYHVWCMGTKSRISLKKRWAAELKKNQHSKISHLTFHITTAFQ